MPVASLRPVQVAISDPEEVDVRGGGIGRDAGRDVHRGPRVDHLDQPAADDLRLVAVGVREQQRELVAAEPRGEILFAERLREDVGDLPQRGVAGVMALAVVDLLEVVEVEQEQAQRLPVLARARELVSELLVQVATVRGGR